MLDVSSSGALFFKSYEEGYNLIESITTNTYQWPVTRACIIIVPKKPVGVHEFTKTTSLADQMAQIQ